MQKLLYCLYVLFAQHCNSLCALAHFLHHYVLLCVLDCANLSETTVTNLNGALTVLRAHLVRKVGGTCIYSTSSENCVEL